jgi:hypothetical protein
MDILELSVMSYDASTSGLQAVLAPDEPDLDAVIRAELDPLAQRLNRTLRENT